MIPSAREAIQRRISELRGLAAHNDDQAAELRAWASKWADKASLQRAEADALEVDLARDAAEASGWRDAIAVKAL